MSMFLWLCLIQDFNLVPVLTAYENIEYPLIMVQEWPAEKRREQVMRLLKAVGMESQADKPGGLSLRAPPIAP